MRPFVRFGRAGIDVAEVFGWCEDPEGDSCHVYSRHAAVIMLAGDESSKFLRYMDRRSIDESEAPAYFAGSQPDAEPEVRRRENGG